MNNTSSKQKGKLSAATQAVEFIQNGMTVGLGTGSTASIAIEILGKKIAENSLKIKAIATSEASEKLAAQLKIPITSFANIEQIDITIDGADEANKQLQLIKGGGGALLREKIVATNSKEVIIIADASKLVNTLGAFPLPVEVVPFGWEMTLKKLQALGCSAAPRLKNGSFFITDNHNYIVDCSFTAIENAPLLHDTINAITGVVENGLFINIAHRLILGNEDGTVTYFSS